MHPLTRKRAPLSRDARPFVTTIRLQRTAARLSNGDVYTCPRQLEASSRPRPDPVARGAMTAEFPRTSYERATREYDREFQQRLTGEILTAIAQASIVNDPNLRIMALRTGETLEALTICLISFAAMSPHVDVPSHLRE